MVQGLNKFNRRWKAIPRRMRDEVVATMEKTAWEIVDDMYDFAPQDRGDLAGSIGWTWGEAPKGSMVIGSVGSNEYAGLRITFYAGDETTLVPGKGGHLHQLAKLQEFGTAQMPANPFFYPTWRLWRRRIRSRMRAAMRRGTRAT